MFIFFPSRPACKINYHVWWIIWRIIEVINKRIYKYANYSSLSESPRVRVFWPARVTKSPWYHPEEELFIQRALFYQFWGFGGSKHLWISWPDFSGLALLLNKAFGDQEGTFSDLTDFDLLGCLLCKRANPSLPPSPPKKVLQMSIISADNLHFLPTEFFFLNSSARLEKSKLYSEKRKGKSQV